MLNIPPIVRRIRSTSDPGTVAHLPPPISPSDIGLPPKFVEWRRNQWDAVERIVNSTKRFTVICAATGFGKSAVGYAAAILSGRRSAILTATKGLQDQVANEAASIVSDIRGLANYRCPITGKLGIPEETTVADAPCQCGYQCVRKHSGGCGYYDDYRQAQRAGIVCTNYQCWLYDGAKESSGDRGDLQFGMIPTGLPVDAVDAIRDRRGIGLLVCDEGHSILNQISMFLGTEFSRGECLGMRMDWPDSGLTVDDWRQWAAGWMGRVDERITAEEGKIRDNGGRLWSKDLKKLRDVKRKLDRLSGMQAGDGWIMNEEDVSGKSMSRVRFDPLSPGRYAEEILWRNIPRVVLVSATVTPKTAELLGIDRESVEFCEYDSSFDVKRRPVIHVPTGVRVTYQTEQDDDLMGKWLRKMDSVIRPRLGRKGIIHAVSYTRAMFIKSNSEFGRYMLVHNSRDRHSTVERYKRDEAPCILVSPSVGTGYDFAGDLCRWQILCKLPFSSVKDKLIKARQELDKEYGIYLTAQEIVQICGRPVRSQSDWAETLILDDSWCWYYWKGRRYMPGWFQDGVVWWGDEGGPEPLQVGESGSDGDGDEGDCVWCGERHSGGPENCIH